MPLLLKVELIFGSIEVSDLLVIFKIIECLSVSKGRIWPEFMGGGKINFSSVQNIRKGTIRILFV